MIIEQTYFQHLSAGSKKINDGKNRIYLSDYYDHCCTNDEKNFTIKFPLLGNIHFKTENGMFDLCPGAYLLSYQQKGNTVIESKTLVRFVCIDIQQQTMY